MLWKYTVSTVREEGFKRMGVRLMGGLVALGRVPVYRLWHQFLSLASISCNEGLRGRLKCRVQKNGRRGSMVCALLLLCQILP